MATSNVTRSDAIEPVDQYNVAICSLAAIVDFVQMAAYSKEVINAENLAVMATLMQREIREIELAVSGIRLHATASEA